jgi:hypothetical protein
LLRADNTAWSDDAHECDGFVCCEAIFPYKICSYERACSAKTSFALFPDKISQT